MEIIPWLNREGLLNQVKGESNHAVVHIEHNQVDMGTNLTFLHLLFSYSAFTLEIAKNTSDYSIENKYDSKVDCQI